MRWCQRFSTHCWLSAVMFFEMRHAAAPAFKRTYIGQCAERLRPSNQSHVLSAAWAQRQLGPRAFSIHDETRLGAIHARLHWLHLPVGHSLAIQPGAKMRTDGALTHYKRVATGLLPHVITMIRWIASIAGSRQSGKVSKMVNSCVALLRMHRTCW